VAASFFYSATTLRLAAIVLGATFWLVIASVLHLAAQRVLGDLRG
jgi:hypothetical protein